MMIAWIVAHWRIAALGVALAIAGWWHQHAVTQAYRQGATDGEAAALQEAAARVEEDTAARRLELEEREATLSQGEARIQGERAALNSARSGIRDALSASLNQIATQGVDIRNEIQTVPDNAVNGRFRLALDRARAVERERAADR